MFSKEDLINYLQKNGKSSYLNLAKKMNVKPNQNKEFTKFLFNLRDSREISYSKKNDLYFIPKFIGNFETEYKLNYKGNAFCFVQINENKEIKATIFKNKIHALKDDLINVDVFLNDDNFYFATINSIVKRKNKFIYAQVDDDLNIKPIYFNQQIDFDYKKNELSPNTYVRFKIVKITNDKLFLELDKTLYSIDQPYSDIELIIDHSEVSKEFSEEVILESNKIPNVVENEKDFDRVDLTNRMIVTIDGEKTKDFDDAISVEKTSKGTYILGVHIADVAYYVQEESCLDLEARLRGTSIYLIDKVIPMLPEKLSNGICSLNPNVKRFTITLEAEIDEHGKVLWNKVYPSLIESKYRLTYNQVHNLENESFIKNDHVLYTMLKNAYELSEIISKNKINEGYINFEIQEPIIELDKTTGRAISIKNRIRLSSEVLIENFMVFANETISKMISDLQIPSIYRVHEAPSVEQIDALKSFIKVLGVHNVKVKNSTDPKDFQNMVNELKEQRFDNLIKMSLLRTMQKAKYSSTNIGHFGLASKCYSHFTSPIRRYPDLLLHRIIWEVIFKGNKNYSIKRLDLINSIAKHSTSAEIEAVSLERKVNDVKKAEFYESMINQVKEATIVSIQKFGIFVEFEDLTNSLVHISTLAENNEFEISEDMCRLKIKDKIYQIGQKVKVKILSISKMEGKIDSIIVN